ncbi:MAG: hypothetical protein ABJD53_12240 [Gammaproteobacteria bacterium]
MADLADAKPRFSNHRQWREFIAAVPEPSAVPRSGAVPVNRSLNWLRAAEVDSLLSAGQIKA